MQVPEQFPQENYYHQQVFKKDSAKNEENNDIEKAKNKILTAFKDIRKLNRATSIEYLENLKKELKSILKDNKNLHTFLTFINTEINRKSVKTKTPHTKEDLHFQKLLSQDPNNFGYISDEECIQILKNKEDWLIRYSPRDQNYVVTYCIQGRLANIFLNKKDPSDFKFFYELDRTHQLQLPEPKVKGNFIKDPDNFGVLPKETMERIFQDKPEGSWLIRYSENNHVYVITKKSGGYFDTKFESKDNTYYWTQLDPNLKIIPPRRSIHDILRTDPKRFGRLWPKEYKKLFLDKPIGSWLICLCPSTNLYIVALKIENQGKEEIINVVPSYSERSFKEFENLDPTLKIIPTHKVRFSRERSIS